MEPLTGAIDPFTDTLISWGFRIVLGALFICLFLPLFNRRKEMKEDIVEEEVEED